MGILCAPCRCKERGFAAADVHFLKNMDASTWIPAGQKSSHNLCLLKQGAVATAGFHFDYGHRYNEECRFAGSLDITVTKMSGEEVYGMRLQGAMPCWRFKQIAG